jgi:hypothetical protein
MKGRNEMKALVTLLGLALLMATPPAHAQPTAVVSSSVTIGAEAGLVVAATPNLAKGGGPFGAFTGTTNLIYFVRTSQTTGSGTIQAKVTSDFSPAGGPSVPTGDLKYSCSASNPGNGGTATACTGSVTASTTDQTIASFGPDARSSTTGNSASVQWTLNNSPAYKAGNYSATVTFTISAN